MKEKTGPDEMRDMEAQGREFNFPTPEISEDGNTQLRKRSSYSAFPIRHLGRTITLRSLERRISHFFDPEFIPKAGSKDALNGRRNMLDLAYWLGYRSRPELLKAMYDSSQPEVAALLLAAVDKLNQRREDAAWSAAYVNNDTRTLLAFIERDDKLVDRYNPEMKKDAKGNVSITINMAREDRLSASIEESLSILDADIRRSMRDAEDCEEVDGGGR